MKETKDIGFVVIYAVRSSLDVSNGLPALGRSVLTHDGLTCTIANGILFE